MEKCEGSGPLAASGLLLAKSRVLFLLLKVKFVGKGCRCSGAGAGRSCTGCCCRVLVPYLVQRWTSIAAQKGGIRAPRRCLSRSSSLRAMKRCRSTSSRSSTWAAGRFGDAGGRHSSLYADAETPFDWLAFSTPAQLSHDPRPPLDGGGPWGRSRRGRISGSFLWPDLVWRRSAFHLVVPCAWRPALCGLECAHPEVRRTTR